MLTTVAKGRTYDFSHAVGGLYMPQPIGVVAGEGDTVFVLSRQYEQILDVPWNKAATSAQVNRFTITEAAGEEEFLGRFSKYGDSEGELIWPSGIARDGEGNLYVADEWMNRVSVFDKDGEFLKVWGSEGSGDGELSKPSGIALDSGGSRLCRGQPESPRAEVHQGRRIHRAVRRLR